MASNFKQQVIMDYKDFWIRTGPEIRCHEKVQVATLY